MLTHTAIPEEHLGQWQRLNWLYFGVNATVAKPVTNLCANLQSGQRTRRVKMATRAMWTSDATAATLGV
eukprot:2245492-Amphidinium_carterae.3